jgi:hypothetical protein
MEVADRAAIRLTVGNEFERIDQAQKPELGSLEVRRLPPVIDIFRMAPSGRRSVGQDIMKPAMSGVPQWQPSVANAGEFLETFVAEPSRAIQFN